HRVLGNGNPGERSLRAARLGCHRLDRRALPCARICAGDTAMRLPLVHRDDAPAHPAVAVGPLHGGEDMRANRTVRLRYGEWNLEDGLECPPNIQALSLAADEH